MIKIKEQCHTKNGTGTNSLTNLLIVLRPYDYIKTKSVSASDKTSCSASECSILIFYSKTCIGRLFKSAGVI
jgi:hypothetical protein